MSARSVTRRIGWRLLTLAVFAAGLLLQIGCVTEASRAACPTLVEYDKETQFQAAFELEALLKRGDTPVIAGRMMPDYSRLRDQVRACRKE